MKASRISPGFKQSRTKELAALACELLVDLALGAAFLVVVFAAGMSFKTIFAADRLFPFLILACTVMGMHAMIGFRARSIGTLAFYGFVAGVLMELGLHTFGVVSYLLITGGCICMAIFALCYWFARPQYKNGSKPSYF